MAIARPAPANFELPFISSAPVGCSCFLATTPSDLFSEEREANAANEYGAISIPARRSVRVCFKIVVIGTGIGLQVRVVALAEKVAILIEQKRETDLAYLSPIPAGLTPSRECAHHFINPPPT